MSGDRKAVVFFDIRYLCGWDRSSGLKPGSQRPLDCRRPCTVIRHAPPQPVRGTAVRGLYWQAHDGHDLEIITLPRGG
jgi:hypothetical protein